MLLLKLILVTSIVLESGTKFSDSCVFISSLLATFEQEFIYWDIIKTDIQASCYNLPPGC